MRVRVVWSDLTYTRTHAFRMRGRTRDPPTSQRDHPFQDIEQGRYTHIPSGKAPMYDERPHATVCDLSFSSYHPRSTLRHPPGKQRKSPVAKTAALARAPPVAVRFPACDPGTSLPDASLRPWNLPARCLPARVTATEPPSLPLQPRATEVPKARHSGRPPRAPTQSGHVSRWYKSRTLQRTAWQVQFARREARRGKDDPPQFGHVDPSDNEVVLFFWDPWFVMRPPCHIFRWFLASCPTAHGLGPEANCLYTWRMPTMTQ
jgi:hypothetical protein